VTFAAILGCRLATLAPVVRLRAVGLLVGAITLAALCLPTPALAGSYTWSMPGDFTATAPGSNPDHDSYGTRPWSYAIGPSGTLQFSGGFDGGLAGWTDDPSNPQALIAVNPTSSPVGGIGPGQFAMEPPPHGSVALAWTAPVAGTASVSGSISQVNPGGSGCGFSWSLSEGGTTFASGSGGGTLAPTPVTVAQGDTIYLVIQDTGASYSASCVRAAVTAEIGMGSTPPALALFNPGSAISGRQPVFSGDASSGFGVDRLVTVRVYSSSGAAAVLAQTLTAAVVNGGYSVVASPRLPNGAYTAQAEQDDAAGDQAFSGVIAFTLGNAAPRVTLHSLGRKPLLVARPTFTGTAGTARGDGAIVYVGIFAGNRASTAPVRSLLATRSANGRFTLRIRQGLGLPDGQYIAVAAQVGPGPGGVSSAQRFEVKVHPPALTIASPGIGAVLTNPRPAFWGQAGARPGDFPAVTLALYRGVTATGRPLSIIRIIRRGPVWSLTQRRKLSIGLYTAVARQSDNAGHTATTEADTFFVSFPPPVIGLIVNLDRRDYASLEVTCTANAGTCTGEVLVVTASALRLVRNGPRAALRVLSAPVSMPAGQSVLVRQKVPPAVARVLRRAGGLEVRVSAYLSDPGHNTIRVSVPRLLAVS
jgi:hypothetical protein